MSGHHSTQTVGALPDHPQATSTWPRRCAATVWLLFVASLGAIAARVSIGGEWAIGSLLAVDGLTALLWAVVTFIGGIVLSYSRRYMAGHDSADRFALTVTAFTLSVLVLVAATHLALFLGAWLAMGLLMAALVGHVDGWEQATAAATVARRAYMVSAGLLAVAFGTLWATTGATTIGGVAAAAGTLPTWALVVVAGTIALAAMVQSALLPFHTWLMASMTAPTPASALMHAGFVNAGGILLLRFAPVVTVDPTLMGLIAAIGAASALGGKLLKTVQVDVKGQLGASTVGQMGFMVLQAGLGFFGAAITHFILHGFYKAHQFLASGEAIEHEAPSKPDADSSTGPLGAVTVALTALAGGGIFVAITGKGTALDTGLLLAGLIVLTTLHGARTIVARGDLPTSVRHLGMPAVFLPAIAIYALSYRAVTALLADLPLVTAPVALTSLHAALAGAFLAAHIAIETGLHTHSTRLYVWLVTIGQAPRATLQTTTEDHQ